MDKLEIDDRLRIKSLDVSKLRDQELTERLRASLAEMEAQIVDASPPRS